MKNYLDKLPKPFFVLAPMDDVTDTVFRQIIAGCAPADLYFTEFVNVEGLQSPGRPRLLKKLRFTGSERPIIAQIWGKNPENFKKTASELVEMGFDGVDLNFGCPVKTVVKSGCGGAIIQNPAYANEIILATQEGLAGKVPLSVKTRIGFNNYEPVWIESLMKNKLNMLSIHLRTVKEMSSVPAHWEYMADIRTLRDSLSPETALVGNGDVKNRIEGRKQAEKYGIEGIMIGRGVFHDPFALAQESLWVEYTKQQKIELYARHVKLFVDTWKSNEHRILTLNKFCKIYINGFDGAKELRDELMHCKDSTELLSKLGIK